MHPAKSIILFTSLSGLGFGLMVIFGLGLTNVSGFTALVFTALALGLASAGLIASLFHLGNPQRFIKALTQIRTSWLSREGVLSILTMTISGLFGLLLYFDIRFAILGYLASLLALATIFSTAMIYAQLRTVPRWYTALTPALFLAYALAGGLLLGSQMQSSLWACLALLALQFTHWVRGRSALNASGSTAETATGLGAIGAVRLLESPHTARNYVTTEMVFRIGRGRASQLKIVVIVLMLLQIAILGIAPAGHIMAAIVILLHLASTLTARWLFFAESEHLVSLYYNK